MKLLPSPTSLTRSTRVGDALGQGVDAALVVVVFLGIGYVLDRWLGTTPLLTIGMFLLAMIGLFYTWKARYLARMEELEAQRHHDATRHRQAAPDESTLET
jgi:F0F1-type ATP synthase assembly protein I